MKTTPFPLTSIVAQGPTAVDAILGEPNAIELVRPSSTICKERGCEKRIYQSGKYEVVFVGGLADWITINQTPAYETGQEVLNYLGLPQVAPTFDNPSQVIWWRDLAGLHEVNFFYDRPGRASYIYIKSVTK